MSICYLTKAEMFMWMLSCLVTLAALCLSVLYFSWHRYEHQDFWPKLKESDFDSVGKDKGAGFNINVPWNKVSNHKNTVYLKFCPKVVSFMSDSTFVLIIIVLIMKTMIEFCLHLMEFAIFKKKCTVIVFVFFYLCYEK